MSTDFKMISEKYKLPRKILLQNSNYTIRFVDYVT